MFLFPVVESRRFELFGPLSHGTCSFEGGNLVEEAKVGILAASLFAGLAGYGVLRLVPQPSNSDPEMFVQSVGLADEEAPPSHNTGANYSVSAIVSLVRMR